MPKNHPNTLVAAYQTTREAYHLGAIPGAHPETDETFLVVLDGEPNYAIQSESDVQLAHSILMGIAISAIDPNNTETLAEACAHWSFYSQADAESKFGVHFEFGEAQ